MSDDAKPLTGPDLEHGVPWDSLADATPLLGQAHGQAIVLVRRGDTAFAVAATCTHYGGPLAEGLVEGESIHCPWHHACFDLRTGEAIGAPALNPLDCYEVERRGSLIFVHQKRAEPAPRRNPPREPSAVVIVGAGPAGAACAEALRREGYSGPVTLVGDELPGPVDRPNLSKDYLAGKAPEEWIPLRTPDFYAEQKIELLLSAHVDSFDPQARTVKLAGGRSLSYGALVLCTGAEPRRLDVPGAELPHVFTLRTLADSRAIIARSAGAHRAVVVGSSFIGLEVAAALRHRELEVHVVAPDTVPLGRVLGDEIGALIRTLHEEQGVRFHLGRSVNAITNAQVHLDDGTRLEADLVVTGVGVQPRVQLAQAAGLRVENGIVVDDQLATSAEHVYAAGDVASVMDARSNEYVRVEHFVVAERQGQAAARSLLGAGRPFRDVPFFWSQHYDLTLSYVGHARRWDRIEVKGEIARRDFAAFYRLGGRVLAVATVGRDPVSLRAEAAMAAGDEAALEALTRRD